jgi:hypothetical protein
MKNLRNLMAWITISVVLMMGTGSVNAGILVGDRTGDSCTSTDIKVDLGVILDAITGIILADRGGIILADRGGIILADKSSTGCQQSKGGIILAD